MSRIPIHSVAQKRGWLPLLIVLLTERGLDFFGVTSVFMGIGLWAVALALTMWWRWPWLKRTDTWFGRFVAAAFPVVILVVPFASVLPVPSTDLTPTVLDLIAFGWLIVLAATTVIVILSYVHRGNSIIEQSRVAQLQDSVETLKRERDEARAAVRELKGKVRSPETVIHDENELKGLRAHIKKLEKKLEESTNERATFPGHMDLESAHPIATQIQQARHVDGIWLTGNAIFQLDGDVIRGTVRRVILPHPDAPLLGEISGWTPIPYGAAHIAVRENTDRAAHLGVEVRWLNEFPDLTLLLADPDDENGYAHLETLLPYTDAGHCPIQRIERRDEPIIFERLVKMFDRLWEKATEPETEKERYQRMADTLTEKCSDGVARELIDGYANAEDPIHAPIQDDLDWVADMLKTMEELGCTKTEIESVNTLGMHEQKRETENAELDRWRSIFNARLVLVRDIADTYQRMAHRITP